MSAFTGAMLGNAVGQIVIGTGDSEKNIQALGNAIDGLDAKTSKFGQASNIGKAFAGIGAAILGGMGVALNTAANFEQRMSAVQAVTSATGKEFDDLRDKALQLGKDTQFSATEAASALEELAKAGVSTKDILSGAADGAVALAAAADTDLPTAATIIANTLNQFQLGGEQATHIADLLAAAANKTATDVTEMGTQLSYAAGQAHSLNISAEDTVAALAALADQGLKMKSGAGLSQMLVSLAAPTDSAKTELDALGISVFDAQGKFVGFTSIIEQFAAATKGMSDEQKQAALNTIFTANGARTMIALLNTETDAAKKSGKSWEDYQKGVNDAGAAADAAKVRMDNFRGSLEQLRGSVETVLIRVGDVFLPSARTLVDGATAIANAVLGLPNPVVKAAAAILGLSGAVASLVGGYILLEPKIARFVKTFNEVKPALLGLLGPAAAVAAALALLGAAYETNFGGLRDFSDRIVGDLKAKLGKIGGILGEASRGIGQLLNFRHGNMSGVTQQILGIAASFQRLGIGQQGAFQMAFALDRLRLPIVRLQNDAQAMSKVVGAFFDVLNGGASKKAMKEFRRQATLLFGKDIGKRFVKATDQLHDSLRRLSAAFKEATGFDAGKLFTIPGAFDAISKAAETVFRWIDAKLLPEIGRILVGALDVAAAAADFLAKHMDTIVAAMDGAGRAIGIVAGVIADDLVGAFRIVGDLARGDFSQAWADFKANIKNTFTGAVELGKIGLSVAGWSVNAAENVYDKVKTWVFQALGGSQASDGTGSASAPGFGVGSNTAIPIGTVAVMVGKWLVGEVGEAAGGVWQAITDFVLGSGGGATGGATDRTGRRIGGGGNREIPLPSVPIRVGKWLISEGESLAADVVAFAVGAWNAAKKTALTLGDYAISIGSWLISEGVSLAGAVVEKVVSWWDDIVKGAVTLGDYAITIGSWLISEGASLAGKVVDFLAGIWPAIAKAGSTLGDYVVQLGSWIVRQAEGADLGAKVHDFLHDILDGRNYVFKNYTITVGLPDAKDVTVSFGIGDLLTLAFDALLRGSTPGGLNTATPEQGDKANQIGQRIGRAVGGAVIDGLVGGIKFIFQSMGGPHASNAGKTNILADLLVGVVEGMWGEAGDIADRIIANAETKFKTINDRFVKWFDGLPGRIWNAIIQPFTLSRQGRATDTPDLFDLVAGLINIAGDPSTITGKLDQWWSGVSGAISGWWSGIGGKLADIFSSGTPGAATGAGFALPGAGQGSIWQGLIDALTPDLSGIGFPKLPDWLGNPMEDIPGLNSLITGLGTARDKIQALWDDIFHINDTEGGHSSAGLLPGGKGSLSNIPGYGGQPSPLPTSAPAVPVPTPVQPNVTVEPPTGTPTPDKLVSDWVTGQTKDIPPVTVTVPLVYKFEQAASGGALGRNGAEPGTTPQAPTVTATFLADDADVAKKFTDVMTWAGIWAAQKPVALFGANNAAAAVAFTDVMGWGNIWGGSKFTATFAANNGPAATAYTDAFRWGDAWDRAVFTASFSVDVSGLLYASAVADSVAAHIAAVMPHSPAKEGPLHRPITFDYIADNMAATAKRLRMYANASANVLADAFGTSPNVAGQFAAAQVNTGAGAAGGATIINQQNFTALHSDEFVALLQKAEQGGAAHAFINNKYGRK